MKIVLVVNMNNIDKHEPHGCKYVLTMGYTQLTITDTLQGVHNTTKKLIRKLKSAIQKIIFETIETEIMSPNGVLSLSMYGPRLILLCH